MNIKLSALVYFISFVIFVPQMALAGAWTAKEGGMYNKVSINSFKSDENFNEDGDKDGMPNSGEFSDFNIVYYGEYGLRADTTVFWALPYKQIKYEDNAGSIETSGIGDVDLGVRRRILEDPVVFSVQALLKIPALYDETKALPLGNGQFDVEVRLMIGKSLHPLPMYFGLEVGYRYRADEPSDEWKYLVELGGNITEQIYARAKLDGAKSVENADEIHDASGNPVATLEYDVGKLELSAGYSFTENWTGELTYTPYIYGKNTAAGRNLSVAVIYGF